MRIATLVLAILGALASAALALVWLSDAAEMKESIEALRAMGAGGEIDSFLRGAYALLAAAALGIGAGVATLRGKSRPAAGVFVVALVAPAMFVPKTLIATFFFGVAAALAFLIRPKTASIGPAASPQLG